MSVAKKSGSIDVEVVEPVMPETGEKDEQPRLLPTSLKFSWTPEERETIETIKASVDQVLQRDYREAYMVVQTLLVKVRIPTMTPGGGWALDEKGVPVWERNPDGSVREDYSRLDAVDIDTAVLKLATFAFFGGQANIDAYMEAVWSKFAAEDAHQDAYASIMTGTIPDKTAAAERKNRKDRYFAFYKAYYHRKAKELMDRLDSLRRTLEFVRKMQGEDRNRELRTTGQR